MHNVIGVFERQIVLYYLPLALSLTAARVSVLEVEPIDRYDNYADLTHAVQELARLFPHQCHLYSVGNSVQGLCLIALNLKC